MKRLLVLGILLAGCAADGNILIIDALPPASSSLGIPVRISAHGGKGVKLELVGAAFDNAASSQCFSIDGATTAVVYPFAVEALVVGQLYEDCGKTIALAGTQLPVRRQETDKPADAGVDCGTEDGGGS